MSYILKTKKGWLETKIEIENEFKLWGVIDFIFTPSNQQAVTVRFILQGKEITLTMDKQDRSVDNLRVIYYTIHTMRMNEVRGMSEIFSSAYLQLNAPVIERDPYEVLGLPRGTARVVCEAQYKELLKIYHPDLPNGSADKTRELNEAIEKIRKG